MDARPCTAPRLLGKHILLGGNEAKGKGEDPTGPEIGPLLPPANITFNHNALVRPVDSEAHGRFLAAEPAAWREPRRKRCDKDALLWRQLWVACGER